jgi:hypothetical protein
MNVLMVSGSFDIGGQGVRFKEAFARYGDGWSLRSVVRSQSYLAYPTDLPFRSETLEELYQACDVFHARVNFGVYDQLAAKFGPKPLVFHAHGSAYRGDPNRYVREAMARNAIILCSTLDLWLLAPEHSVWMPAPFDVEALAAMA